MNHVYNTIVQFFFVFGTTLGDLTHSASCGEATSHGEACPSSALPVCCGCTRHAAVCAEKGTLALTTAQGGVPHAPQYNWYLAHKDQSPHFRLYPFHRVANPRWGNPPNSLSHCPPQQVAEPRWLKDISFNITPLASIAPSRNPMNTSNSKTSW